MKLNPTSNFFSSLSDSLGRATIIQRVFSKTLFLLNLTLILCIASCDLLLAQQRGNAVVNGNFTDGGTPITTFNCIFYKCENLFENCQDGSYKFPDHWDTFSHSADWIDITNPNNNWGSGYSLPRNPLNQSERNKAIGFSSIEGIFSKLNRRLHKYSAVKIKYWYQYGFRQNYQKSFDIKIWLSPDAPDHTCKDPYDISYSSTRRLFPSSITEHSLHISDNNNEPFWQDPNSWHYFESDWITIDQDVEYIGISGNCSKDNEAYIWLDGIELEYVDVPLCDNPCYRGTTQLITPTDVKYGKDNSSYIPVTPNLDGYNDIGGYIVSGYYKAELTVFSPEFGPIFRKTATVPNGMSNYLIGWNGTSNINGNGLNPNGIYALRLDLWDCNNRLRTVTDHSFILVDPSLPSPYLPDPNNIENRFVVCTCYLPEGQKPKKPILSLTPNIGGLCKDNVSESRQICVQNVQDYIPTPDILYSFELYNPYTGFISESSNPCFEIRHPGAFMVRIKRKIIREGGEIQICYSDFSEIKDIIEVNLSPQNLTATILNVEEIHSENCERYSPLRIRASVGCQPAEQCRYEFWVDDHRFPEEVTFNPQLNAFEFPNINLGAKTIEVRVYNVFGCMTSVRLNLPEIDKPNCCVVQHPQVHKLMTFSNRPVSEILSILGSPDATISKSDLDFIGSELALNGTITIDQDVTFYGLQLDMGPNAKIIVQPNRKVTFDQTRLVCCKEMWQGIEAPSQAQVEFKNNSLISCAEVAVLIQGTSQLICNNSQFDQNYVGIKGVEMSSTDRIQLNGSTIKCSDNLKAPHAGQRSLNGIEIVNSKCHLFLHQNRNFIQNQDYGIHLYNSSLRIKDFTIEGIDGKPFTRKGIFSEPNNGTLETGYLDILAAPNENRRMTIKNCQDGIHVLKKDEPYFERNNQYSVEIENTDIFTSPETMRAGWGILIEGRFAGHVDITYSTIKSTSNGIKVGNIIGRLEDDPSVVRIEAVDVFNTSIASVLGIGLESDATRTEPVEFRVLGCRIKTCRYGINAINWNDFATSSIISNEITDVTIGIKLHGNQKGRIEDNVIKNVDPPFQQQSNTFHGPSAGISLIGCDGAEIIGNSVNGQIGYSPRGGSQWTQRIGYYFIDSRNASLCKNEAILNTWGLVVKGGCFDMSLRQHRFLDNLWSGIRLYGSTAVFGPQYSTFGNGGTMLIYDNSWGVKDQFIINKQSQTFLTPQPRHLDSPFFANGSLSGFYTRNTGQRNTEEYYYPLEVVNGSPVGHSTESQQCANINACRIPVTPITNYVSPVDRGNQLCTTPRTVYPTNPGGNGNRPKFSNEQINIYNNIATGELSYPVSTYNNPVQYQDKQYLYSLLAKRPALRNENPTLLNFFLTNKQANIGKLNRIERLMSLGSVQDSLEGPVGTQPLTKMDNNYRALRLNSRLSTTNPIEENHKQFNNIFLVNRIGNRDTLTSGQLDSLKQIARQCPFTGGRAVLQARAYLMTMGIDSLDNVDTCADESIPSQMRQTVKTSSPEALEVSVYPNPSQDGYTLSLESSNARELTLEVHNITGVKVLERKVSLTAEETVEQYFDTQNWVAGLYLCTIRENGTILNSQKLILTK
jgi:hypothetical protein